MATKESCGRLKSPELAALLSFFYMRFGHIYIGETRKGTLLILLYTASLGLIFVLIGLITTRMLWLRGMVYVYESAEDMNRQTAEELAIEGYRIQEAELVSQLVLAEPLAE